MQVRNKPKEYEDRRREAVTRITENVVKTGRDLAVDITIYNDKGEDGKRLIDKLIIEISKSQADSYKEAV